MTCKIEYDNILNLKIHGELICSDIKIAIINKHYIIKSVRCQKDKIYYYYICYDCFNKIANKCHSKINNHFVYGCDSYLNYWFISTKEEIKTNENILLLINTDNFYIVTPFFKSLYLKIIKNNIKQMMKNNKFNIKYYRSILLYDSYTITTNINYFNKFISFFNNLFFTSTSSI